MARRGPIRVPEDEPDPPAPFVDDEPSEVVLPKPTIIDAGMAKFHELARQHWPAKEGGFKLTSFDMRNDRQLRYTLGLVFMAMKGAEEDEQSSAH